MNQGSKNQILKTTTLLLIMSVGIICTVLIQTNFGLNSSNVSQKIQQSTSNIPEPMVTAPKVVNNVLTNQKNSVTNKKPEYNNRKDTDLVHSIDSSLSSRKNGLKDPVLISDTQKNQTSINSFKGITITQMNTKNSIQNIPNSITSGLTVSISPSSWIMDLGTTRIYNASVSGGSPRYTFTWSQYPSGCTQPTNIPGSLVCKPTVTGTYTIKLDVSDTSTNTGSATTSLTINPFITATLPTATPASKKADVGQNVHFQITVSGGTPPYTIQWQGLWSGCNPGNTASFTCLATSNGTFSIDAPVVDSLGDSVWGSIITYQVLSNVSVGTPTVSSSAIDLKQSVTFSVTPKGGTGTYSYVWSNLPSGCIDSGVAVVSCTPTGTGTFNTTVTVTDSNSFSTTSSIIFNVYNDLSISQFKSTSSSLDVGQSTTFTVSTIGGSNSYSYAWYGLPNGCSSSDTNSLVCNPTNSGNFNVKVTVTDSNSYTVTSSPFSISVFTPPTVSLPVTSSNEGLVGTSVTFTTNGNGGSGSLTYSWTSSSTDFVCSSSTVNYVSCTPKAAGDYTVTVKIQDSNGGTASATSTLFHVPSTTASQSGSGKHTPGFTSLSSVIAIFIIGAVFIFKRRRWS